MILYFNTKIVHTPLINAKGNHDFFYPVVYPRAEPAFIKENPFEILLRTIGSYASLPFSRAIFNIEVDLDIPNYKAVLESFIQDNFGGSEVILRFERPSTVQSWIEDINRHTATADIDEPVLVVMNHDHPFVDYAVKPLYDAVEEVFSSKDNFQRVLYYSHAPEVISWATNGRGRVEFKVLESGVYYSSLVNDTIDSIGIMTFRTLLDIWNKAIFSGTYVGRIDWKGLSYQNLNLTTYVYPREFFRHYDGYNHITGTRFEKEISRHTEIPLRYPSNELSDLLEFYYVAWRSNFTLMIRDKMADHLSWGAVPKSVFVDAITNSLDLFYKFYLQKDVEMGLLDAEKSVSIQYEIENKIYYNANELYRILIDDINLLKPRTIKAAIYRPLIRLRAYLFPQKFIVNPR